MKLAVLVIAGFLAVSTNAAPYPDPEPLGGLSNPISYGKDMISAPQTPKKKLPKAPTPADPTDGGAGPGGLGKGMSGIIEAGGAALGAAKTAQKTGEAGAASGGEPWYGGGNDFLSILWSLTGNKDIGGLCNSIFSSDFPKQMSEFSNKSFNEITKEASQAIVTTIAEFISKVQREGGLCSSESKLSKFLNKLLIKAQTEWLPVGLLDNQIETSGLIGAPGTGLSGSITSSGSAFDEIFDLLNLIPGFEDDELGLSGPNIGPGSGLGPEGRSGGPAGPGGASGSPGAFDGIFKLINLIPGVSKGGPDSSETGSGESAPGSGSSGGINDLVNLISSFTKGGSKSSEADSKPVVSSKPGAGKPGSSARKPEAGLGKPGAGTGKPGVGSGKPGVGAGTGKPGAGSGKPGVGKTGPVVGKPGVAPGKPWVGEENTAVPGKSGTRYPGKYGSGYISNSDTGNTGNSGTDDETSGVDAGKARSGSTRPSTGDSGSADSSSDDQSYVKQSETDNQEGQPGAENYNDNYSGNSGAANPGSPVYDEDTAYSSDADSSANTSNNENSGTSEYNGSSINSKYAKNSENSEYADNYSDDEYARRHTNDKKPVRHASNPTNTFNTAAQSDASSMANTKSNAHKPYSKAVLAAIDRARSKMSERNSHRGANNGADGYFAGSYAGSGADAGNNGYDSARATSSATGVDKYSNNNVASGRNSATTVHNENTDNSAGSNSNEGGKRYYSRDKTGRRGAYTGNSGYRHATQGRATDLDGSRAGAEHYEYNSAGSHATSRYGHQDGSRTARGRAGSSGYSGNYGDAWNYEGQNSGNAREYGSRSAQY